VRVVTPRTLFNGGEFFLTFLLSCVEFQRASLQNNEIFFASLLLSNPVFSVSINFRRRAFKYIVPQTRFHDRFHGVLINLNMNCLNSYWVVHKSV
jgi:hypothetical protein